MKITDSRNAHRNSRNVRSSSRARPATAVEYAGRHVQLACGLLQRLHAVRLRETRADVGAHVHLPLAVLPVDARRAFRVHDAHDVVEPDQLAGVARHQQPAQLRRVVAIGLGQPQLDVVVVVDARVAEARDLVVAAYHDAQRRGDVLRVHAEVGRAVAVDLHLQLGLVQPQRGVRIDDADLGRLQSKALAIVGQRRQLRTANGQVEVAAAAAQVERLDVANAARAGRETSAGAGGCPASRRPARSCSRRRTGDPGAPAPRRTGPSRKRAPRAVRAARRTRPG